MTRIDYFPGFAKAKTFYENEYPEGSKKPWPFYPSTLELAWEKQSKDLINPTTKEYYKGSHEEQPEATVTQIVRIKTTNDQEFLYSIGSVTFYDMFGDAVVIDRTQPETFEEAKFHHKSGPNAEGHIMRVTDYIEKKITRYDMPFNSENVDKLWAMRSPDGCMLTVKDDRSSKVGECKGSPNMSALDMFKTQTIDYIIDNEWQSPEQREVILKEEELFRGKKR